MIIVLCHKGDTLISLNILKKGGHVWIRAFKQCVLCHNLQIAENQVCACDTSVPDSFLGFLSEVPSGGVTPVPGFSLVSGSRSFLWVPSSSWECPSSRRGYPCPVVPPPQPGLGYPLARTRRGYPQWPGQDWGTPQSGLGHLYPWEWVPEWVLAMRWVVCLLCSFRKTF